MVLQVWCVTKQFVVGALAALRCPGALNTLWLHETAATQPIGERRALLVQRINWWHRHWAHRIQGAGIDGLIVDDLRPEEEDELCVPAEAIADIADGAVEGTAMVQDLADGKPASEVLSFAKSFADGTQDA